jgi:hypothetical protein
MTKMYKNNAIMALILNNLNFRDTEKLVYNRLEVVILLLNQKIINYVSGRDCNTNEGRIN